MEIDTVIITHCQSPPISANLHEHCPASCALPDMIQCWIGLERRLRADLIAATVSRSPDAEMLRADLRAAEDQSDRLLALALGWAA
jgi:hypothetical protein